MLVQRENFTEPVEAVFNVTQEVSEQREGWNSTSLAYVFIPLGLVICLGLAAALVRWLFIIGVVPLNGKLRVLDADAIIWFSRLYLLFERRGKFVVK